MSSGLLVLIVAAMVGGLIVARLWRSAEARAADLAAANEKLGAEREDLAARLSRESQARKKQAEELAAQRKRVDKAKKRKAKGTPDLPLGTASRIGDLTEQLERVERERDRSRAEREALAEQVAQLEARLEISARATAEASIAPAVAAVPTPERPDSDSENEALHAKLNALDEELRAAHESAARLRKRMGTQEQLYASVRAELEVKKDRLRTQEEQIQRLQALKVAVSD